MLEVMQLEDRCTPSVIAAALVVDHADHTRDVITLEVTADNNLNIYLNNVLQSLAVGIQVFNNADLSHVNTVMPTVVNSLPDLPIPPPLDNAAISFAITEYLKHNDYYNPNP